jgi:NAD(P)H-flavin reductase
MLAACRHVEDMHIITLEQILYLAEKGRLKITFKFRESPHRRVREGQNISLTSDSFQKLLDDRLKKGGVSRVWICGPPGMNIMVSKYLR